MLQLIRDFVMNLQWFMIIIICLTLGLAPFFPVPHIWEKLKMLYSGTLVRPLDWFDLMLHSAPWILLILKMFFTLTESSVRGNS
ncbi:MAG: RND transporter [SAR324 cluster bacterium]|nr:RND transporter [SAR324 cluster bacterium]MBL7035328.1 RND transporter [SAR324 cluster bacterium]